MLKKFRVVAALFLFAFTASLAVSDDTSKIGLSAKQIADKNAEARGGLHAWRAVQTMSFTGRLTAGGNQRAILETPGDAMAQKYVANRPAQEVELPFLMEFKRPRKMRVELQFKGETALQVFDGTNGWKLRPYLGRRVVESYTPEEIKITETQSELDGPLLDYEAKGTRADLDGMEKVEGRDTYKLKLTTKTGQVTHVWIDARTFLEAKVEGQPRRLDGTYHPVEIYFRDYRLTNGLQIPYLLETRVLPVVRTLLGFKDPPVPPEKAIIDKVAVNPKLDDSRFSKPEVQLASATK